MWLWASIHGGFVVGLGYLVLDGLRRRDRSRIADVIAATLVTVVTAHGWGVWEIILKFFGSGQALDLIVEWLSPDLLGLEHFPFALGILALLAGAISGRLQTRDLWVIAPFLLFAFTANRAVPIAALALAPFLTGSVLNKTRGSRRSTATSFQGKLNALLIASVLLLPALAPLEGGLDRDLFAVEAINHLGPERTFHDDGVGGYLIYSEWPERMVYIDDRAELYGAEFVDFVRARAGHPVWREVIEEFRIRQALLKIDDPLAQILTVAGWEERYKDDKFVVLAEQDLR
jgi:hypothetical protein